MHTISSELTAHQSRFKATGKDTERRSQSVVAVANSVATTIIPDNSWFIQLQQDLRTAQ